MVTGLVLVKLQAGKEKEALKKIKEVKAVSHVSAVYGRWDLVLDMETPDLPTMSKLVVEKIRTMIISIEYSQVPIYIGFHRLRGLRFLRRMGETEERL